MSTPPSPSSSSSDMKIPISPTRASNLTTNLTNVLTKIKSTQTTHGITKPVRLVAVSKLKPASDILALHSPPTSQLHFGENYVQELVEKARILPGTIRWHFMGGLQSNKCRELARDVPGLWAVESVDSIKKVNLLNKGRGESENNQGQEREQLRIFVQVNTSGEESKSGVAPKSDELAELCRLVHGGEECPNLKLQGLMTIGAIARSKATTEETENEDFVSLRENRDWVAQQLGLPSEELELSMGMSEDYVGAIVQGSDEVRVGSTIFGERPPKKEAKILENTEEEKK